MKHLPAAVLMLIALTAAVFAAPPPTPQERDGIAPTPPAEVPNDPVPAAGEDVDAAERGDAEGSWLADVPASQTVVFSLSDPLPHIERVLESPRLRRVMLEGDIAKAMMRADAAAEPMDPLAWRDAVREVDRYIPVQATLAVSPESAAVYASSVRGMAAAGLAYLGLHDDEGGLIAADDPASISKEDLATLHQELASVVQGLKQVDATLVVTMRDEEDAQSVMMYAGMMAPMLAANQAIQADFQQNSMWMSGTVGDQVPREILEALLLQAEVTRGVDGSASQVIDAVASLTVTWAVRREGRTLVMQIGPSAGALRDAPAAPAVPSLKAADLGPLWSDMASTRPLVFVHYDLRPMLAEVDRLVAFWGRWRETPVGERAMRIAGPAIESYARVYAPYLEDMGRGGALSVTADDDAMRMLAIIEGLPQAKALSQLDLTSRIPMDAEAVLLDSTGYMESWLTSVLTQAESQINVLLYTPSIVTLINGGEAAGDAELDPEIRTMLAEQVKVIAQLRERTPGVFGDGFAVMMTTRGKADLLELTSKNDLGELEIVRFRDAAVPEVAVLMDVSNPQDAVQQMEGVFNTFAQMLNTLIQADMPGEAAEFERWKMAESDMGLGVASYQLELAPIWASVMDLMEQGDLLGPAGGRVEGDIDLHLFFPDDRHAVLSSSPRLSLELATGWQDQGVPMDLRSPKLGGPLKLEGEVVSYLRLPSSTAAKLLNNLASAIERAETVPDDETQTRQRLEAAANVRGLQDYVDLTQGLFGRTTQKDGTRETVLELRLAE